MLSLGIIRKHEKILTGLNLLASRATPLLLTSLLITATANKYLLLLRSSGGGDLLGADIPKSLMLLHGQNPYTTQQWAAPYPPFLLLVIGQIIRWTTGDPLQTQAPLTLVARNIMLAGVAADLLVALLLFLTMRARGTTGPQLLLAPGLFLLLPAISVTPYFWFHSDELGYPILGGSLLALEKKHYLLGSTLLGLATIFKIHPLLAIPLVIIWIAKRHGLKQAIPSLLAMSTILLVGLVLPFSIPGYTETIMGFNLSTGFGNGTSSFTIMNLFYSILPTVYGITLDPAATNQVWVIATTSLFTAVLGIVWKRAKTLHSTDVVLLGLLVWLIPLRQLYTHYVVWAMIPLLARGRTKESIIAAAFLELGNTLAVWAWNIPPNPLPMMNTIYGFFLTSLVYTSLGVSALFSVVTRTRRNPGL